MRGLPVLIYVMSNDIFIDTTGNGVMPFPFTGAGGKVNASTSGTFSKWMCKVLSVICTALSGTFTIQKRPLGKIPGLKSCNCDVKLTSQRSIHISTNVPRAGAEFV